MPWLWIALTLLASLILGGLVEWGLSLILPERPRVRHLAAVAIAIIALTGFIMWASTVVETEPESVASRSLSLEATTQAIVADMATVQALAAVSAPVDVAPTMTRLAMDLQQVEDAKRSLEAFTETRVPAGDSPTDSSQSTSSDSGMPVSAVDGMVLLPVPAGEFQRGATADMLSRMQTLCPLCDPDTAADQAPGSPVYLDAFWIDAHEVTVAQFGQFVSATGYTTTAESLGSGWVFVPDDGWREVSDISWRNAAPVASIGDNPHPVTQVSWDDATAYCQWAGRRLPTEAEWEKAARSSDGRLFPWGDTIPDETQLNYDLTTGTTMPVGSFPAGATPYGALDMAGNVWEWVQDYYDEGYYLAATLANPAGPATGEGHILRGGSWATYRQSELFFVMTTFRLWNYSHMRSNVIGFRCATSAP